MLALGLTFVAAIALSTETPCPSEAAVRASLAGLGVGARDREGAATWALENARLTLTVQTASTATAAAQTIERAFPLGPCVELADQVALAIERATSPLGFLATPIERPSSPTAIGVHAGAFILPGAQTAYGWAIGADVWPWNRSFGAIGLVSGTTPRSFAAGRVSTLEISRYTFGAGLAMRHRFTDGADAGFSFAGILEHIRGDPGGVQNPTPLADWRAGLRAGGFGRLVIAGPFSVGAEVQVRIVGKRSYRAIPATELVVLGPVELEAGLNLGAIFF